MSNYCCSSPVQEMYGKKPMESASNIQSKSLPSIYSLQTKPKYDLITGAHNAVEGKRMEVGRDPRNYKSSKGPMDGI